MMFREKLRLLRKERRMSQLELAETLNVSRQAISKWEQGIAMPNTENLIQIGKLFGVAIEVLTDETLQLQKPPETQAIVLPEPPKAEAVKRSRFDLKRFRKWLVPAIVCVLLAGMLIGWGLTHSKTEDAVPIEEIEGEVLDITSAELFSRTSYD